MTPSDPLPRRTKLALGAILVLGLAVRLLYLAHATSEPRYRLHDPDSYLRQAERIARGPSGWRFDFDAVEYGFEDRRYALPPLYPVFLSLFALLPGFPINALVAQALLATAGIACTFALGRAMHSDRAGLVAASLHALWFSNVIAVWSTMTEAVFVPLLLAGFVALMYARSPSAYALSGSLLGLSALSRSLPLYFVPLAALLLVRRHGVPRGGVFGACLLLGFALPTVPYSVALSRHLGEPTFIENHGGLLLASQGHVAGEGPPGPVALTAGILGQLVRAPLDTIAVWASTARSILHVNGGRLLQLYLAADGKVASAAWKIAAHLFTDLSLVLTLALAPFGFALCRRPDRGAHVALWALVAFGLTSIGGYGGARMRAPFEPQLMAAAGVVLALGWRAGRPWAVGAAAAVSAILMSAVVPQLGRSFSARGDYGVEWPLDPPPKRSATSGGAGFNVLASKGFVDFSVRPRNRGRPTRVSVAIDGRQTEEVHLESEAHRFRYPAAREGLAYVELVASDLDSGGPAGILVVVPR